MNSSCFQLTATDGLARAGTLLTGHGAVRTPVFMPVGTKATVKATTVGELESLGAQIILGNTYHLVQRPGVEAIETLGGLHAVTGWRGPILTDSGGFQVFSLRDTLRIDDEAAVFRSVYDGDLLRFTPEGVADWQVRLGTDIAMVLDQCPPGDGSRDAVAEATRRTTVWARRARAEHLNLRRTDGWSLTGRPQLQFGIVQGGVYGDLREQSAAEIQDVGFDGYAIGGLSVGESRELTMPVLERTAHLLPAGAPRYFMGIGDPVGVLDVIARGVDMFDCVLPTRLGRTASAMVPIDVSPTARLNMRNAEHASNSDVMMADCTCPACAGGYSRAYLRHLVQQQEILGLRMLTLHNLHVMLDIVTRARAAICAGTFQRYYATERARWAPE